MWGKKELVIIKIHKLRLQTHNAVSIFITQYMVLLLYFYVTQEIPYLHTYMTLTAVCCLFTILFARMSLDVHLVSGYDETIEDPKKLDSLL